MLKILLALSVGASLGLSPVLAQDSAASSLHPAEPGSVEMTAGSAILSFVQGRTKQEAMTVNFNPYQIDGERLLATVGAFFVSTDYDGAPLHEGELAIYPQFNTPLEAFEPSATTPAIIPFALVQGGVCHGGIVYGYPVPDSVDAVDMTGEICHAAIVEEIVYADYFARNPADVAAPGEEPATNQPATNEPAVDAPPARVFDQANPTPLDLDTIVWAAYSGAFAVAMADADYAFVRGGDTAILRQAIATEIAKESYGSVALVEVPTLPEAYGCALPGIIEVRFALSNDGFGITLVAATSRLVSTYVYDPQVSTDIDIAFAHECRTEGFGRPASMGVH